MSYQYNQMLKYVYFEGYADSYEEAEYILEQLSDEEFYELCENVSTGKAKRASSRRAPIPQRVSDSEAREIRRNARENPKPTASAPEDDSLEAMKSRFKAETDIENAQKEAKKPKRVPSRGIGASEKVLRKGKRSTPGGTAQQRVTELGRRRRELGQPNYSSLRDDRRSKNISAALKKRDKWGTPEARNEEFVIDYLINEGYTDNYDSAIAIYESMSDEWLNTILVNERYYKPHEKLPSGNTPYEKATASYKNQDKKYYSKPENERTLKDATKMNKQIQRVVKNVSHGADNPHFNTYKDLSGEVNVTGHKDQHMTVRHPKSGIRFSIYNTGKKTKDGKPVHDVEWHHNQDTKLLSNSERRKIVNDAKDTWTKHISHRLPHGSVIRNFPLSNYGSDNAEQRHARAAIYSRVAGFGRRNDRTGYQFAGVGREPSPRQKAKDKNKKRTYPMNSNTETSSTFGEEQ